MSAPTKGLEAALATHAAQRPNALAISDERVRLTWREVNERVKSLANQLPEGPLGLCGDNSCAWVLTYIAALLSRRTVVPMPSFFSAPQREHITRAASLTAIVTTANSWNGDKGQPIFEIRRLETDGNDHRDRSGPRHRQTMDAVVVFTSGSTGQPKGVRLTLASLLATADGLVQALKITEKDSYLSVLPLPMLLEQVCAVLVPLLTGAHTTFNARIPSHVVIGRPFDLIDDIAMERPSILVLVPQLLSLLVDQVKRNGDRKLISSLRYIAVGGAAVGSAAVGEARSAGLPVFEGYGLTECSSVVALNTPEHDFRGSVGRPIAGQHVRIVDGEICVSGSSVMAGYLGSQDFSEKYWRTGDVGEVRADGALVVHGRKDNLIVCSNGRNVSPEWIEASIVGTHLVRNAVVVPAAGNAGLTAVLVADWHPELQRKNIETIFAKLHQILPTYALPHKFCVISTGEAESLNLYRMGKPDRRVAMSRAAHDSISIKREWEYEAI
jgi:long-subunit acyl-CoA synthetase (AMP-forming)